MIISQKLEGKKGEVINERADASFAAPWLPNAGTRAGLPRQKVPLTTADEKPLYCLALGCGDRLHLSMCLDALLSTANVVSVRSQSLPVQRNPGLASEILAALVAGGVAG